MKSVILGGSGFMGRRLAEHLCLKGHELVTISRSPMAQLGDKHQHRDVTLDDRRALDQLMADTDFVFHLASDTTPGSSRLQPSLEVSNNLLPLAGLLDCLQNHSSPVLVYVSSGGAIYAASKAQDDASGELTKLVENSATAPPSYYGAGKLAAEAMVQTYCHQATRPAIILRPANVYGPGQNPKSQFGIIPTLCRCLLEQRPFTLWGDGAAVRDFVYIDDFLSLCERVIETSWSENTAEIFNVGTGQGCSIATLCELLQSASGRSLDIDYQPPRGVDSGHVVLDSSRAHDLLKWSAATSLQSGLEKTWAWHLQQA